MGFRVNCAASVIWFSEISMPRIASLLVLPVLLLAACTPFDTKFTSMAPPYTANPAAPLAGMWEGSWQSDSNAYIGRLRAIALPTDTVVVKNDVPAQQYVVEFEQRLYEAPSPSFTVRLNATVGEDGKLHFTGKHDTGGYPMNGIVTYEGYVEGDKFFCDYRGERDCGTYIMRRIVGEYQ
jgi:hypothetical protein